ncbi:MAG: hypothetical protein ABI614_11515 [Planctomycetota bacterium]
MAVQCAKCGEELMGAVNRCWRCGQEFVVRSTEAGLPPIRRSPVVTATGEVWDAELSEAIATTVGFPVLANPTGGSQSAKKVRRGSPFADRGTATLVNGELGSASREGNAALEREARYRRNGGAAAGAAMTMPLGLISFIAAFLLPLAGFPLALLGLGFGVWGLSSRRRGFAVAGLLLCCLSLAVAIFNGSVELFTTWYGVTPWGSDPSLP